MLTRGRAAPFITSWWASHAMMKGMRRAGLMGRARTAVRGRGACLHREGHKVQAVERLHVRYMHRRSVTAVTSGLLGARSASSHDTMNEGPIRVCLAGCMCAGDSPEASLCADSLALAHMQRFCQWVNRTMLGCLYPGELL